MVTGWKRLNRARDATDNGITAPCLAVEGRRKLFRRVPEIPDVRSRWDGLVLDTGERCAAPVLAHCSSLETLKGGARHTLDVRQVSSVYVGAYQAWR